MIQDLHKLRDLLQALEYVGSDDPAVINEAISITERLIQQHEKPVPVDAVGLCYRLPTPPPPKPVPVAPPAPKFGGRQARRFADDACAKTPRKTKVKPDAA